MKLIRDNSAKQTTIVLERRSTYKKPIYNPNTKTQLPLTWKEAWTRSRKWLKAYFKTGFSPESGFRIIWDLVTTAFIMRDFLLVPIQIAFDITDSDTLTPLDYFVDAFFIVDLILNFFTGYYHRGALELDYKRIRRKYIRGWFWVDLFSSIPYDLILPVLVNDAE